jgi:hypothetical protein
MGWLFLGKSSLKWLKTWFLGVDFLAYVAFFWENRAKKRKEM